MLLAILFSISTWIVPAHAEEHAVEMPSEAWSLHFQATILPQYHGSFDSPYSGTNSLSGNSESETSFTSTLYLGRKLWSGAEVYLDPEISAGTGFSGTHGIAGFPNGEIYRVDSPSPKGNLSRLYIVQTVELGGERLQIEADKNQLAKSVDAHRLTFVGGKFSLNDFFDNNTYAHDPRTQFMNWAFMDNGAWDYAADTRGYTWGFMIEYDTSRWAVRLSSAMEPKEANQLDFDTNIAQAHGDQLEFEYHYALSGHPGAVRPLIYGNHAHMGSYEETLSNPAFGMDITKTRQYRTKYGFGLNLEQEIRPDLGLFSRLGWDDGATESWAFAEIDRTLTFGASLRGASWNRADDTVGLALIVNGLSQEHADYLAAGGYGFMLGDGRLNYSLEEILETYYSFRALKTLAITADYQFVNHPAYNADRGPVSVISGRLHYEF